MREMAEEVVSNADDDSWMEACVSVDMTIETMPFDHSSRYNSFFLALTLTYDQYQEGEHDREVGGTLQDGHG